jgi:hypothetical protein
MILMSWFSRPQGLPSWPTRLLMLLALSLSLLWAGGCARPKGLQNSSNTPPAERPQVPFHDGDSSGTERPSDPFAAQDNGSSAPANLPFRDPQNLPAGTLLTVRLKAPISAENPTADASFEAVVDQPVVIEGSKLIPRGAAVSGRIESAQTSNLKRNRGYVRLVLKSIHLAGANLQIQTASLFVRGSATDYGVAPGETPTGAASRETGLPRTGPARKTSGSDPPSAGIRLEKGRLLTFRLTEPAYVAASERTPVDH